VRLESKCAPWLTCQSVVKVEEGARDGKQNATLLKEHSFSATLQSKYGKHTKDHLEAAIFEVAHIYCSIYIAPQYSFIYSNTEYEGRSSEGSLVADFIHTSKRSVVFAKWCLATRMMLHGAHSIFGT